MLQANPGWLLSGGWSYVGSCSTAPEEAYYLSFYHYMSRKTKKNNNNNNNSNLSIEVLHKTQSWNICSQECRIKCQLGRATLVRPNMIIRDLSCPPPNAKVIHPSGNL